ncbi:Lar family restriction alleviation protein [Bradyrhizobium sp. PMVTL-01]|uniref:Lar family restriction alleviation protein n=1 Tax=Bradyrhizobium sp. PMVTL-01 TaxID=3434999 RepID=UPI003F6FA0B7
MTDFLPCPFCGVLPAIDHRQSGRGYWMVHCMNKHCDVVVEASETERGDALKKWNARALVIASQPQTTPLTEACGDCQNTGWCHGQGWCQKTGTPLTRPDEPQEASKSVDATEFHFWMDMRRFPSMRGQLTGAEIKAIAGTNRLYQIFRDTGPRMLDHQGIGDGVLVDINDQHFYSLIPATHCRGDIG